MNRSASERARDVGRLVEAARDTVRDRAAISSAIAEATGLSRQGVELGFTRHVELDPTDAEILSLVEGAGVAREVHVILSANVFVAALRAIAIARAAAPRVVVRPSRRDPSFARALVAAARDAAITLAEVVTVESIEEGEIHVYGRDETIADVQRRAASSVVVRGHGAGMGVALVGPTASLPEAARALAWDVVAFDQRGCLSPRIALVEGEPARAEEFAGALDAALGELARTVPRGLLAEEERALATRYADALAFAGSVWRAPDHVVGLAPPGAPLVVPPSGRHVHVAHTANISAALAPLARAIVAVGSTDTRRHAALAPPHARISALGEMQRPRLDGPVDLRRP